MVCIDIRTNRNSFHNYHVWFITSAKYLKGGIKMVYKQVKSQFIKDKIKGLEWNKKNKEYIDNLVFIENYILTKTGGMGISYIIQSLESRYKKEFKAIYNELKPKELEQIKKREEKERRKEKEEHRKFEEEERKDSEQAKKEWFEMGGK